MNGSKDFKETYSSGLTWRVISILVLSSLIFIPASTYLNLLTGGSLGGTITMFMLMLVSELFLFLNQKLTQQETLVLYYGIGAVSGASWSFVEPIIFRAYLINSPFAWSTKIDGKPLALLIPNWMAPPYGSPAYQLRTLFNIAFLPSLTYYLVKFVLSFLANISISALVARIYVEKERLTFPFARVDTSLVTLLTEPSPDVLSLFLLAMTPGIAYSAVVFLQYVTGTTIIPIPYLDLTQITQVFLPGFIFAIPTILSAYIGGFMVSPIHALYIFITSTIIDLFGTLFLTVFPDAFPEWRQEYFPGMGMVAISSRLSARVWFAPRIGMAMGVALIFILKSRKTLLSLLKSLIASRREETFLDFPSDIVLISVYLFSTTTSIAVFHYLVPEVPLWIPIFISIIFSFFQAVLTAATQGATGYSVGLPDDTWIALVYLSPYKGYAGLTSPPVIAGNGTGGFSQQVKACVMTGTKPSDLIKLSILTTTLSAIVGLVVIDYFWRMAPIPSMAYPNTILRMPSTAITHCLLASRELRIDVPRVVFPGIIVFLVALMGEMLGKFGMPWSIYGFALGLFIGWPSAFGLLVGSLLGNILIARYIGKEKWESIKSYLTAGEGLGEGIVTMLLTIITLFSKSSWIWPW